MKVEVVLTEADIAQEFAEAMQARDLPEKFFFWFPRSATEWAALIEDAELYGGLEKTWRAIATDAPALVKHFGGRVPVISFGACAGGDDEDIETVGIKADISSPVHLVYAADAAEPPRLLIMSGNTLGSFDPLAEIRYVAQCMKPDDRLIIDGEIHNAEKTMPRRDNPAARKFLS